MLLIPHFYLSNNYFCFLGSLYMAHGFETAKTEGSVFSTFYKRIIICLSAVFNTFAQDSQGVGCIPVLPLPKNTYVLCGNSMFWN